MAKGAHSGVAKADGNGIPEAVFDAIEAFLDEKAAALIAAAAVAFLLKLGRDFVVDRSRQAASVRIVAVYIRLAVG